MKKAILFLFTILVTIAALSQTPGITWQRTFGTSTNDNYYFTVKTNDNGIISIYQNGNPGTDVLPPVNLNNKLQVQKFNADGISQWQKTFSTGGIWKGDSYYYNSDGSLVILCTVVNSTTNLSDLYLVKIDANGNLVWEKYIDYGIGGRENGSTIIKSANGDYLISGTTRTLGGQVPTDVYILRISEDGNLVWQQKFDSGGGDGAPTQSRVKIIETNDASIYVLSESSNGWNNSNRKGLWVLKLNSDGIMLWAKPVGGSDRDYLADFKLSPTGEFYVLGYGTSPELIIGSPGYMDIYFARVSMDGDILFQKNYGSSSFSDLGIQIVSIEADGSAVLAGQVGAGDVNVSGYHGAVDIWLFKIDHAGAIIWEKAIGGSADDRILADNVSPGSFGAGGRVLKTSDGGYLISGLTQSSTGDVTGFHGEQDVIVVKLSSSGNIEWTRSLGGSGEDYPRGIPIEYGPNEYVIGGITYSNDGDVQKNTGGSDPWLVKLGSSNTIKGTVFIDQNGNGIKDASDPLYAGVRITITSGQKSWVLVPYNGQFSLSTDTGNFVTSITPDLALFTPSPVQHTTNFTSYYGIDSFSIALTPVPGIKDLVISLTPLTPARPGFFADYNIHYSNVGTIAVPPGKIKFVRTKRSGFISSSPSWNSWVGDSLTWNLPGLPPGASGDIFLRTQLLAPPVLNIGDVISTYAFIGPIEFDQTPYNDTSRVWQTIQGSLDPNDKAENHNGRITPDQVAAGEYLNYTIRFQNMGTDTAFNIHITDILDSKLDWSSFEMVSSSHVYQLQITSENKLTWTFNNIKLPHSSINEPGSHGFISYRIKPKSSLGIGATISNKANIYFDFNLPVETNLVLTTVGIFSTPLPLRLLTFDANYKKPDAILEWSTADESNVGKFIIERGTDPVHFIPVGTLIAKGNSNMVTRYQFKDGLATTSGDKFYYRLKMMDRDQKFTYSNIQLVKREGRAVNELLVNPNPIKGRFGIAWINLQKEARAEIGVVDMKGNYRSLGLQQINKGFNVVPLDFYGLSDGTYLLQVKIGQERLLSRFVLVQ